MFYDDRRKKQLAWVLYFAALVMFVSSLFVPAISAYETSRHGSGNPVKEWAGWWLLLLGPLGVLIGQLGWFANPLMLASAMPIPRRIKLILAGVAIALALSTVTITSIPVADAEYIVKGGELGFALWLGCPFVLLLAALAIPEEKEVAARKLDAGEAATGP